MSWVMTLPQFNIYLYSPTSTSVQISVAMTFSGKAGMLMEFDNTTGDAINTMGFDCSWISRFKEEDERYLTIIQTVYIFVLSKQMFLYMNKGFSIKE